MLRKWFLILVTLALSAFLLVACDATSPAQTNVPANTPQAVMLPALQTSGRTMLVYFLTSHSSSTNFTDVLRRYDINTHQSVDILKLPDIKIEEAQISADGQWILYVAYVIDHDELRLVRIDGRYAQTLLRTPPYAGIRNAQWSPDQKQIAFAEQPPQSGPLVIYLLTLAQRHIQSELISASQIAAPQYVPREWLDNTRLLVTDVASIGQGSAFQHLALLDTRKGGHQQPGDLQALYSAQGQCGDYATGADATQLFLLNCSAGTLSNGSSTISVQPLSGGTARPLFHSATLSITQIRQFTPQSLLLISNLTVWSIHNDGTGLTQLFGDSDQHGQENFCQFSRSSWSNFARDGRLLALVALRVGVDTHTTTLVVGSPGGGSLQAVTSGSVGVAGSGSDVYLVGWTTL